MMNGKGDAPRNCFSKQYKDNYETINWSKTKSFESREQEEESSKRAIQEITDAVLNWQPDVHGMR
jgi:hypothetical protein